jgi:general secretion pathway protein G
MIALRKNNSRAFSLIELVIVVVIIGIIGAIAIPRMSRGSKGATENALRGDLAILRNSIELYAAEHDGAYPTLIGFTAQLEGYTDFNGNTNAAKTPVFEYGPYILAVPAAPVGPSRGLKTVSNTGAAGVAWVYDQATGKIFVYDGGDTDSKGVLFGTY